MADLKLKSRAKRIGLIISVLALLILVQPLVPVSFTVTAPASAVSITPGVVLDPTGTPCKFNWQHTYEDNGTLIVEKEYIKVGGIKCECEPSSALTVMVNDWNPGNKDKAGEVLFSLSTVSHTSGDFTMKFHNLPEDTEYRIFREGEQGVWKNVTTDDEGVLIFSDEYHSQNDYIIQKAEEGEIVPPPFPPEEEGGWPISLSLPIILIGVSTVAVIGGAILILKGKG